MANMKPDQIRTMQRQLVQAGFDVGPTGVDGIMGAGTHRALLAFQKQRGLTVNGVAGPKTKAALAKPPDVLTGGRPSPRPGVPPTPQTRPAPVQLGQGLTGPAAITPRLRPQDANRLSLGNHSGGNGLPDIARPQSPGLGALQAAVPPPPQAPPPAAAPLPGMDGHSGGNGLPDIGRTGATLAALKAALSGGQPQSPAGPPGITGSPAMGGPMGMPPGPPPGTMGHSGGNSLPDMARPPMQPPQMPPGPQAAASGGRPPMGLLQQLLQALGGSQPPPAMAQP